MSDDCEIELLHPHEAAKFLKIQKSLLDGWRWRGGPKIPYVKMGAQILYRKSDLETFIENSIKR